MSNAEQTRPVRLRILVGLNAVGLLAAFRVSPAMIGRRAALDERNETFYREEVMNMDQVKGRIEEAKGEIKKVTGKAVGNKNLEHRGSVQKAAGQVLAGYGDLKQKIYRK